jgi:hypothetical protein
MALAMHPRHSWHAGKCARWRRWRSAEHLRWNHVPKRCAAQRSAELAWRPRDLAAASDDGPCVQLRRRGLARCDQRPGPRAGFPGDGRTYEPDEAGNRGSCAHRWIQRSVVRVGTSRPLSAVMRMTVRRSGVGLLGREVLYRSGRSTSTQTCLPAACCSTPHALATAAIICIPRPCAARSSGARIVGAAAELSPT